MPHRASFPAEKDNEFYIMQPDGDIYSTEIGREIPFFDFGLGEQQKFNEHAESGYHPDCVICRGMTLGQLSDPRTPAQPVRPFLTDEQKANWKPRTPGAFDFSANTWDTYSEFAME